MIAALLCAIHAPAYAQGDAASKEKLPQPTQSASPAQSGDHATPAQSDESSGKGADGADGATQPESAADSSGSDSGDGAGIGAGESTADEKSGDDLSLGVSDTPIFRDDFLPENLPKSEIDAYSPWRGVAGAFFVLAILFIAVWILRKLTRNPLTFAVSRRMRVIETLPLSMGKQIHLVQVGAHVLIVGSTQNGLSLLGRMRMDDVAEFVDPGVEFVEQGTLEPPSENDGKRGFKFKLDEIKRKLESVKRSRD